MSTFDGRMTLEGGCPETVATVVTAGADADHSPGVQCPPTMWCAAHRLSRSRAGARTDIQLLNLCLARCPLVGFLGKRTLGLVVGDRVTFMRTLGTWASAAAEGLGKTRWPRCAGLSLAA